jgi:hypothetical protein
MSRKTKETLQCQCILTDAEKLEYGIHLAECASGAARKTAALASYNKQVKAEIGLLEDEMAILSEKLNTGKEFRGIECRVVYNWETQERFWIRTDTEAVEKQDVIPEQDLQEQLKLGNVEINKVDASPASNPHAEAEAAIDEAQDAVVE